MSWRISARLPVNGGARRSQGWTALPPTPAARRRRADLWRTKAVTARVWIRSRPRAGSRFAPEGGLAAAILDTITNLVVVLDRQGRIVRFNRACERATGYTFPEVAGRELLRPLPPPPKR